MISWTILILVKSNTNLITTNSQIDVKNNRIQNLFRNLQKDPKSVFYSVGNLSKSILNKAIKSVYEKDKVFVDLYNRLEDQSFYQNNNLPLVTPFVNKKVMLIIQHSIVLVNLLNYYMLTLQIQCFWPNLLFIRNIVFYWLIYLLQKYTFIRWKIEVS